jgi:germination protein M
MNKRIFFLTLIVILALLLSGCTNPIDIFKTFIFGEPQQEDKDLPDGEDNIIEDVEEDTNNVDIFEEDSYQITLYYKDSGDYIVPVVRNFKKEEGIAKAALSALVDSTENRNELKVLGLQPVLPANTQIELAIKEDGLIRASFSDDILKMESKQQEESMVSALVYTLTEFETIDKVQILVNNEIRDSLTYGTEVGEPISRGNINALNNTIEGEHARLTLYMYNNPTGQYTYFVPVTKNVPSNSRNIETALKELVASKGEFQNLHFNIPEGTTVFGVNMEDGIAYVNFSEHLTEMTDVGEISNLTKAIALTLKEFEGVQGVKLAIDGENALESEVISVPTFANSY